MALSHLYMMFGVILGTSIVPSQILGEYYSFVAQNGQSEVLRCLGAQGMPHLWEASRVKGDSAGQRIDVSSYLSAGALSFTADDTVNTGDYRCVDGGDGHRLYDQYVVLTAGERLEISPNPVVLDQSGETIIAITFVQFPGTPERPHVYYVDFLTDNSSENLGIIREHDIDNGVASFTFTATKNGTIRVRAEFRVTGRVQTYIVTSLAHLTLQVNPNEPSTNDKGQGTMTPGVVAGIVFGVVGVPVIGILCVVVIVLVVWKVRRCRPNDYRRAPMEGELPHAVDPQPQGPRPEAVDAEEERNIAVNQYIPLVPHPQPGAAGEEGERNVADNQDIPLVPMPQPGAPGDEEECNVEGGINIDTQSAGGFSDGLRESQCPPIARSEDVVSTHTLQSQHEERHGLDGQVSTDDLLAEGSSS